MGYIFGTDVVAMLMLMWWVIFGAVVALAVDVAYDGLKLLHRFN